MDIDPVAFMRPARAADWVPALIQAANGAPAADQTSALGLAAALAIGMGRRDSASHCLGRLCDAGTLGQVLGAALGGHGPASESVAALTLQERDWVVVQCYRAGRAVPSALVVPAEPDAALEDLDALKRLKHQALASTEPAAIARGLTARLDSWDGNGDFPYHANPIVEQLQATILRLGLRAALADVDGVELGEWLYTRIGDSYDLSRMFSLVCDRLMGMGYREWVPRLAEGMSGPDLQALEDIVDHALLRRGTIEQRSARLADVLRDRASRPLTQFDRPEGVLPSTPLAAADQRPLLAVVRAAPPSAARTATMAQLAALAARGGDPEGLVDAVVAEVRALIDPRAATDRWAGHSVDDRRFSFETMAGAAALLDLARAAGRAHPEGGLALVREAEALAARDTAGNPVLGRAVGFKAAKVIVELDLPLEWLSAHERELVESTRPDAEALAAAELSPMWARTQAVASVARQGAWDDAVAIATSGEESRWWEILLGVLARVSVELDDPDAFLVAMQAVGRLPLEEAELPAVKGRVLRDCLGAQPWNW